MKMKKTALALALASVTGVAQADSFTINPGFTFSMYDPTGALIHADTAVTGTVNIDMITGAGTAQIASTTPFFGQIWTAHNITFTVVDPGNTTGTNSAGAMLFDWGTNVNIPVTIDQNAVWTGSGVGSTVAWTTIDGEPDGIPGNAMTAGPFVGFSPTFNGTITNVPVPAAVWLFGSGLIGLVGVARRKKAA